MAKKPSFLDLLYLGNAPKAAEPSLDPFAVERKKVRRGKPAPRDFNIPRTTSPEMYAPRQGVVDTIYDALNRVSPNLGEDVKAPVEAIVSPAGIENALRRGYEHLRGGDVYATNPDLQAEDAMLLGITGAAPGVMKGLGVVGRGLAGMAPKAVREPLSRLAARGADWARESAPLMSAGEHPLAVDPGFIEAPFAVQPGPRQLETSYVAPQRVSGPPRMAELPAPGPGLPEGAAKPRGGQFYPDVSLRPRDAQSAGYRLENYTDRNGADRYAVITPEGKHPSNYVAGTPHGAWDLAKSHFENNYAPGNLSPEAAARAVREEHGLFPWHENGPPEPQAQLGDWLEKALAKYYKTDFGAPSDPLRELAARGMHYDPEMTPERWQQMVNDSLSEDPIGYFTVPRHESDIRAGLSGEPVGFSFLGSHDPVGQGALMQAAPWLRKQPVSENLYGIRDALDLGHFSDEMTNALTASDVGLPPELAVRPESLQRMSFPQAAEHVGKINQWRAKQAEQAALSAMDSPALSVFKDYPENNPRGLRWMEIRAPEGSPASTGLSDTDKLYNQLSTGDRINPSDAGLAALQDALKYEGDVMGHCVGGYCDDVVSGRSRIFSLRDAKGEPHVTIETSPGRVDVMNSSVVPDEVMNNFIDEANAKYGEQSGWGYARKNAENWARENNLVSPDIVQIKGKQNRAPNPEYLLFVQDFVKSGKWGDVGDIGNTGLVRLPDGRYITQKQWAEGVAAIENPWRDPSQYDERYLDRLSTAEWESMAPYFKGFAVGGRVDADRCFCRHPMAVKR